MNNSSMQSAQVEEANLETISRMAKQIAHDLNNHLTVILGLASLLQMRAGESSFALDAANRIEQASNEISKLSNQLSDFARSGKVEDLPVDLHRVIEKMIEELCAELGEDIHIIPNLSAERSTVCGDARQLECMIRHLLANAADAMPNGGEISLGTGVVAAAGSADDGTAPAKLLQIRITDAGSGIADDIRDRVFDPFFTTKVAVNRLGLGLAIVRRIATGHGGSVELENDAATGAIFKVCLPLADSELAALSNVEGL